MKIRWMLKYCLAPAGDPAPQGGGDATPAAPNPTGEPAPADPKPAEPAATQKDAPADPKPTGTDPKPADAKPAADKTSLLGGAAQAGDNAGKGSSAEPTPDGGKTGDGQPQDPYSELKLPEGAAVDATQLAGYKKLAGEIGLSAEHAQRVLDFEAQRLSAQAAQAAEVWKQETTQKYGDGLTGVLASAARAVDTFGGEQLRALLDQTGLGNHPLMVEAFSKAGAMLKEDTSVPSNGGATGDKTFAEALYAHRLK